MPWVVWAQFVELFHPYLYQGPKESGRDAFDGGVCGGGEGEVEAAALD